MSEKQVDNISTTTQSDIVLYQSEDGTTRLEVKLQGDTVWLTQAQMSELFQKDQSVIARHINNAIREGEINEKSNMHFLHNTYYSVYSFSKGRAV